MTHDAATTPGGARRARTDARLAETVTDLLRRSDYAGLTIERVAAESGVAKTTIYRRWATKAEMVFDLTLHRTADRPTSDTGTLAGDVEALAERAVRLVAGDPGRTVLPGLLADMAGDADLTARLRASFVETARDDVAAVLERARDRGELASEPSVSDLHAALLGIPYTHVHLFGRTDTAALVRSLTAQLLTLLGARPGA